MDLIGTLKKKIITLEEGDYSAGLRAVLLHIETSFRHLSRGQESGDETAFTDAIFRTNQAFEGSVKESYRVLAEKDPDKKRPYDIEVYLEKNEIFRSRVLTLLTNYRTEWRNPSTHDYKLDFDESEAFLAIVSVSAFACLLLDQIVERLAYKKSQVEVEAKKAELELTLGQPVTAGLLDRLADLLNQFCTFNNSFFLSSSSGKVTETQVLGALHGFLVSVAPELKVQTDMALGGDKNFRADLVVARGEERVLVELKNARSWRNYEGAVSQLEQYMSVGGVKEGILLFYSESQEPLEVFYSAVSDPSVRVITISPSNKQLGKGAF